MPEIETMMRQVKLGGMAKGWRSIPFIDPEQYVTALLKLELLEREANRINRRMKKANFRVLKTLDEFVWTPKIELPNGLTQAYMEDLSFLGAKENLIFMGTVGTGKTHLATAIALKACQEGRDVRFFTAAELGNILLEKNSKGSLNSFLAGMKKTELIVIDEVGFVPLHKDAAELLFQVISDCYERRSLIITSKDAVKAASVSYSELLDLTGSGLMGYVEIPKLALQLPIYHGTEEEVLQKGVGHLIGSSLPIGGTGFHSVLTGHSGVAGMRLFSDLDQLVPGDVFFLHVLGETLAYQVVEINTVLPNETDLLLAVPGEDLCTLVTCTPFGVNTHRLLVRGSRIPYEKAEAIAEVVEKAAPVKSTWAENYRKGLVIGGGLALGVILLGLLIAFLRKKRRKCHEA